MGRAVILAEEPLSIGQKPLVGLGLKKCLAPAVTMC